MYVTKFRHGCKLTHVYKRSNTQMEPSVPVKGAQREVRHGRPLHSNPRDKNEQVIKILVERSAWRLVAQPYSLKYSRMVLHRVDPVLAAFY